MFGWMIEVNNVLINGGEKAIYTLSENNFWLFNHKMLFVALTLPLTVSWFPRPVLDLPVSITRCPDSSLVDIIIHHHHHHPSSTIIIIIHHCHLRWTSTSILQPLFYAIAAERETLKNLKMTIWCRNNANNVHSIRE